MDLNICSTKYASNCLQASISSSLEAVPFTPSNVFWSLFAVWFAALA